MRNLVSPHVHVDSLDSASTPEAFAKREVELDTGALVVTDHGTLQATRAVYDLCHGKKYKGKLFPILGLEAYFRDENDPLLIEAGIPHATVYRHVETGSEIDEEKFLKLDRKDAVAYAPHLTYKKYIKYSHITMHFMDEAAFQVACRLLSKRDSTAEKHGKERKPIFDWADLEELGAQNVTMGSGCLIGMVQRHILDHERFDLAEKYYQRLRSIVKPGNFLVEVFPHTCDRNWDEGVVVRYEDGTEDKFPVWKNLRMDRSPKKGEGWKAEWLADEFRKNPQGLGSLRAVMENRQWVEREPKVVVGVEQREGFIQNECKPWAPGGDVQHGTNRFVLEMARKYGDPVLVSDDAHFTTPDEKVVQDIRLGQSGSWRMSTSYHRFSNEEAWPYFRDRHDIGEAEFQAWVENSHAWAEQFKGFKFSERRSLPTKFYPKDTLRHTIKLIREHGRLVNDPVYDARLKSEIDLLHWNGIIDLLPYFFIDEEVVRWHELHGELTGPGRGSAAGLLLAYLLGITHVDPIRYGLSRDRFITKDRIQSGKLPDIDQDLMSRDLLVGPKGDGNGGWLRERFGECYAQISVDTKLKLKSAVKDVARWARAQDGKGGFVPPEIEMLTKKFLEPPQGIEDRDFIFGYRTEGGDWVEGSVYRDVSLQAYIRQFPEEWEQVQRCLGLTRQKGRHPCAFVISDTPVSDFIPLTSVSGVQVTQFTAPNVEAAGGLKMDFLVVNSLKDIAGAIQLIQDRHGCAEQDWQAARSYDPTRSTPLSMRIDGKVVPLIRVVPFNGGHHDIWDLPEDQAVFGDICQGKTETVFQFNTPGAVKWLRLFNHKKDDRWAIGSIEDMAAFTALDRPGPLNAMVTKPGHRKRERQQPVRPLANSTTNDNTAVHVVGDRSGSGAGGGETDHEHNMLVEYANRARGGERSQDILPIFDQLLPSTYGIMCFQESLQAMYQHLTGCTGPEAEEFRSNVAKKKMKLVQQAEPTFIEQAGAKIGHENAKGIFDFFVSWGEYGFNKSHAVCYVIIAYACAWLKHHYPLEWWTSVLTHADKKEVDETFWPHCGHLIKLPDINKSSAKFEIEDGSIRAPLSLIQGIGPKAQVELDAGRPYVDVDDYCRKILEEKKRRGRSALHNGITYKLICAGVMDSLFPVESEIQNQRHSIGAVDRLRLFEEAWARANKKKNPKPPDKRYVNLNAFQRYQLKKDILTAYGEDLRILYLETDVPNIIRGAKGPDYRYYNTRHREEEILPLANVRKSDMLQQVDLLPDGGLKWAVAAYIVSDTRQVYQVNKKMAKLVLDVEGRRQEFVKWPDKEGKLPQKFHRSLNGSLVVAILSRYAANRPTVLEDLVVVAIPLELKEEEK